MAGLPTSIRPCYTQIGDNMQISTGNLYKLLRDFHTLTNFRIELYDKDHNSIIHYPPEKIDFCRTMYSNPCWEAKCEECDKLNFSISAKCQNTVFYRCHLGLMEGIVPIYDSHGLLGYAIFGQVLAQETSKETRAQLKKQFSEAEFPGISAAIDCIPEKNMVSLEATVTITQALVAYMLSNQWVAPDRSEFIRHMDEFIANNLSKTITVDDICAEFHIRRTRLYSVATEYLGCSIAKYIRQQRIAHACRMICTTTLPITEIAYAVGFSDYGHFSRVFQQVNGMSATAYRHRYAKQEPKT